MAAADPHSSEPPAGVKPLFITETTQKLFGLVLEVDVTEENPWKWVPVKEMLDDCSGSKRGIQSCWREARKELQKLETEDCLVVMDPDWKYKTNFYLCLTPEAVSVEMERKRLLQESLQPAQPQKPAEEPQKRSSDRWFSLGSDKEIDSTKIQPKRDRYVAKVSRARRLFHQPVKFSPKEAYDYYAESPSYRDRSMEFQRKRVEVGVQAAPVYTESTQQTDWNLRKPVSIQVEAITFEEDIIAEIVQSKEMRRFLCKTVPIMELALRENDIVDILADDFSMLSRQDDGIIGGSKTENSLRNYISFNSNTEERVTCIEWHPKVKGVVAMSLATTQSFDERVEDMGRAESSFIYVWHFSQNRKPKFRLEAPADVLTFRFNPTQPHLVVGGCVNGQVCLWDISEGMELLKVKKGGMPSVERADAESPVFKWKKSSTVDTSHRRCVNDVQWFSALDLHLDGTVHPSQDGNSHQLASISSDGTVRIWDSRKERREARRGYRRDRRSERESENELQMVIQLGMSRLEAGGELCGARLVLPTEDENQFHFYCSSEDGEFVHADWRPKLDEEGKPIVGIDVVRELHAGHYGPALSLERNPFFPDIFLTVGDWRFHVWKLGASEPLLSSYFHSSYLRCAAWSPQRPGVFFVGLDDGTVEVWDLIDQTNRPSLVHSMGNIAVESMRFWLDKRKNSQLLAIGDDSGGLHVMELPRGYARAVPDEDILFSTLTTQELTRLSYVQERWVVRDHERAQKHARAKEREMEATSRATKAAAEAKTGGGIAEGSSSKEAGGSAGTGAGGVAKEEGSVLSVEDEEFRILRDEFLQLFVGHTQVGGEVGAGGKFRIPQEEVIPNTSPPVM